MTYRTYPHPENVLARVLVARLLVQTAQAGIPPSAMREALQWVQGTGSNLGVEILSTATLVEPPAVPPRLMSVLEALRP